MLIGNLALLSGWFMVAFEVSRGSKSYRTQGKSVHLSVRWSVDSPCLSQPLQGLVPGGGGNDAVMDGRTDECTDSLCVLQDLVPL